MRQLEVYYNDVKAGVLTELHQGNGYRFEYIPEYLASNFPHVSVTLPKSHSPYEDDRLFPFFANLLPEGTLRRLVCRENHIDENDLFGILCAMSGTDTIGAISLKTIDDEKR